MEPVEFMLTAAGLVALIERQNGVRITQLGVTETAFIMAPTVTSLPGEFKRIDAISGIAADDAVIHMTAQDHSSDIYELRGMGLYLEDGTLFAIYSQPTPLFRKVSIAFFLLAMDIAFGSNQAGSISFGDATFLMPPATELIKGVAEIATPSEASARIDHQRIITPLTLGQQLLVERDGTDADLTALANAFDTLLAALTARTITGSGLVTGGGSLAANRVLTVLAATAADIAAGSAANRAVTPAALSGLARSLAQDGHALIPGCGGLALRWGRYTAIANGTTNVLFPIAFTSSCFIVVSDGVKNSGADSQDNAGGVDYGSITANGFSVFSADDSSNPSGYLALGV